MLAGGEGTRLGFDKSELEIGGELTLYRVLEVLGEFFSQLLVVTPRPLVPWPTAKPGRLPSGVALVADRWPGAGPLGALHTGLEAADDELSFVAACDLPFLSPEFVGRLLDLAAGFDVVLPRARDGLHPLCAVYRRTCLPPIAQALAAGTRRVISFYPSVRVRALSEEELRAIDPELLSLHNINTPADLRRAEEIANATGGSHARAGSSCRSAG